MSKVTLENHQEDTFAITADFTAPEHDASGLIKVGLQPDEDGRYRTAIDVREPEQGTTVFTNFTEADNRGMLQDERRLAMCVSYAVRRAREVAEFRAYKERQNT